MSQGKISQRMMMAKHVVDSKFKKMVLLLFEKLT